MATPFFHRLQILEFGIWSLGIGNWYLGIGIWELGFSTIRDRSIRQTKTTTVRRKSITTEPVEKPTHSLRFGSHLSYTLLPDIHSARNEHGDP